MAEELQKEHGDLVTSVMTKAKRPGKVFLDWSQNSGSKTTVSPYSLRGKERPTAATPLTWDEVEAGAEDDLALDQFTLAEVLERVATWVTCSRHEQHLRMVPASPRECPFRPGSFTVCDRREGRAWMGATDP